MPNTASETVLLTDTNAAYKLYFFKKKGVIPSQSISIDIGAVQFHPIVLEEVEGHVGFWKYATEYNISNRTEHCPNFFKDILPEDPEEILKFVRANLCSSIDSVDTKSEVFLNKRRIYEAERNRLQAKWKAGGSKGAKVESMPSLNDYSILFSAESSKFKIVTHDEILFAIATEILEDASLLRVEDIIRSFYQADPKLKPLIESVITNLEYINEPISKIRIFDI